MALNVIFAFPKYEFIDLASHCGWFWISLGLSNSDLMLNKVGCSGEGLKYAIKSNVHS